MARKRFADARIEPALRAVAEDAIIQSLDGCDCLAEGVTQIDAELRQEMIATAAYLIAEQRGFAPGHEEEDRYRAEAAIDSQLPRLVSRD